MASPCIAPQHLFVIAPAIAIVPESKEELSMQPQINLDDSQKLPLAGLPSSSGSASSPMNTIIPPGSPMDQTMFYVQDDDEFDPTGQSSPFVSPFQNSASLPTLTGVDAAGIQDAPATPATPQARSGFPRMLMFLLIGALIFITIGGIVIFVLVQSASSAPPEGGHGMVIRTVTVPMQQKTKPGKSSPPVQKNQKITPAQSAQGGTQGNPNPSSMQGAGNQGNDAIPSQQMLGQLGWTQAGLTAGDAIESLRTARTFVDREMSYDYRNIGTPDHHGGTFTGAVFLLTSGAQQRFVQNDVREINNVLYNTVLNEHLIQEIAITQAQITKFQVVQVQGQIHQFAWVNVSFHLWQDKIDRNTGQHTQGMILDPTTQQPRTYQMTVLLLRVTPQAQGLNAPMGGTGWLVNTYALNPATSPGIETNPAL